MLRVLLFFQLLYVVNQLHFPWETGIPGVAPANLLFLLILLTMRDKPEPLALPGPDLLRKPMLRFFAVLGFAFLFAQLREPNDFIADVTYIKNALFFPLFYFLYLHCKQDQKTTRQLIIFVMIVAAVAGLEAVREGIDYGFGKYNPFRRASGPFGVDWHHANRAGVFYAMFIPMFVAFALFLRRQKLWRLASIGGIVLLAGGTLFTYSRQSYFLVLLGAALLLIRRSLIMAVVLSAGLISLSGYLPDAVTQRVGETKQQKAHGGGEEVDVSTSSRWDIWEGAMSMLREHPLGVGLNRFKSNIGNYCRYKGMDAHNFYVLTLAETGFQGLIPLLLLWAALLRLARFLRQSASSDDPEFQALALGFTVTTVIMMLGGIYGSPHFEGSVLGSYWALCGLLERYAHFKLAEKNAGKNGPGQPPTADADPASLAARFPLAAHILPGRR